MTSPVTIGNYLVHADSEQFRIFPKGADGTVRPIPRDNRFLYLRCKTSGSLTVFKRYLHQNNWFYRDSRDKARSDETLVLNEIARMLYNGDKDRAGSLLVSWITGGPLA